MRTAAMTALPERHSPAAMKATGTARMALAIRPASTAAAMLSVTPIVRSPTVHTAQIVPTMM